MNSKIRENIRTWSLDEFIPKAYRKLAKMQKANLFIL